MDPFAPDSDAEDEGLLFQALQKTTQAHTDQSAVSTSVQTANGAYKHTNPSSAASRHSIDENDGPPASLVLDTHEEQTQNAAQVTHPETVPSPALPQNAGSESVRLARLGKQRESRTSQDYLSDEEEAIRGVNDEEAGLMGNSPSRRSGSSPSSLNSHSRRGKERGGLLSSMARKVRQSADRIRMQDSVHTSLAEGPSIPAVRQLGPKERALWAWGTLENLDEFLQEVYSYYIGKGLVCILLTKVLNLVTIAFVIGFSTFLVGCVDYSAIKHDGALADVVVGQCIARFSGLTVLIFALFLGMYSWQVVRFGLGISKLIAMRDFYTHLLNIPDADVQAISWHEVVSRISHLRQTNPTLSLSSSQGGDGTDAGVGASNAGKLDAHDVANRIMRQENYLVALFNKDVLDLRIPFVLRNRTPELTRTLEWNLTFCLLGFLFDSKGQVRRQFVTERHRKDLIEGLRRRFIFMAVVNAIFAPFIVIYLLFYSFFRYFEEYHKNPSSLGARQYTQFARWKFREFNELPHIFRRRCHNSYPYAQRYIDQFPKERIAIVARFVSFIAGSFTAVLLLASVIDPDLFLHFDVTPQRNVLFYIGVFGAVLAVSRAMVPDEQQVFEPEVLLRAVVEYTHYVPEPWKGRFHSAEVHTEFGQMYRLKVYIFVVELLSVLFTPFILWKSLPRSAPAIIDFFREFTVHVDGLGYVCSFAVFDFKRHGNVKFGAPHAISDTRMSSNEGKMEQSLLGFRAAHPTWLPSDPTASLFLSRLAAEVAHGQTSNVAVPAGVGKMRNGAHSHEPTAGDFSVAANGSRAATSSLSGAAQTIGVPMNFTPANSTLAQRSQMYTNAFDRSILLAAKPSNAAALHASATKTGQRSVKTPGPSHTHHHHQQQQQQQNRSSKDRSTFGHRTLQAVDEDRRSIDEADPLDANALSSMYEDVHPNRLQRSVSPNGANAPSSAASQTQHADLRGLLHHIGTSRW